jgi:hypothetical protein
MLELALLITIWALLGLRRQRYGLDASCSNRLVSRSFWMELTAKVLQEY